MQRQQHSGLLLLAGLALAGLVAGAKQEEKMGGHQPGTYNHGIATHHRFDRGGHADDHEELDEAEEMFDMRRRGPRARKRHGSQFEQGDTNRDGVLDVEEYKAIYRNPLERLQETDAKYKAIEASDRMKGETFPKIDTDSNGVISRGEWDSLMKESEDKGEGPDPDMMEEHKIINGLQKRLRSDKRLLHELKTHPEREEAFTGADADGDNAISLEEFQSYMVKPHDDMEKEAEAAKMRRTAKRKEKEAKEKEKREKEKVERETRRSKKRPKDEFDEDEPTADANPEDLGPEFAEHVKNMERHRSDLEERFRKREAEMNERVAESKKRIRNLRVRAWERTFLHYDHNRDGKIDNKEWHVSMQKHQGGAEGHEAQTAELKREALAREATRTAAM